MKKAKIIMGKQGSGKTKKAIEMAQENGGKYVFLRPYDLDNAFTLGGFLAKGPLPTTIVVDECSMKFLRNPKVKDLVTSKEIQVELRGHEPMMVDISGINWIFVLNAPDPRRFDYVFVEG